MRWREEERVMKEGERAMHYRTGVLFTVIVTSVYSHRVSSFQTVGRLSQPSGHDDGKPGDDEGKPYTRNSKMIYFLRTGRDQRRQTSAWVKQNIASLVSGPSEMMAQVVLT
jgi:hypothetical protein